MPTDKPPPEEKKPVLEEEIIRKIEAYFGIPFDGLQALADEWWERREWERIEKLEKIGILSLRDQAGRLIDRVLAGEEFVITIRGNAIACLRPYKGEEVREVYKSVSLARQRKKLVAKASEGILVAIKRREKIVALLAPLPKRKIETHS